MADVFALLLLIVLVGFMGGLVAPRRLAKTIRLKRDVTRKHATIVLLPIAILLFILIDISAPQQKTPKLQQTSVIKQSQQSKPKVKSPVVTTKQETDEQSIPYATQDQNDGSLPKGQTEIAQQGQNGTKTLTYTITYTNGQQTNKTLASTIVTKQPTNEIVDVGTYVAPPTPAPAAATQPTTTSSCHPTASSGNCYEPGEYCSDADHSMVGLAGDGKTIICEDNDGWRWEPE